MANYDLCDWADYKRGVAIALPHPFLCNMVIMDENLFVFHFRHIF